jgi:NTE family protein
VLKAVAEMLPPDCPNPFPILSGTSAGAINATTLAIYATRFHEGVRRLVRVWQNFHVDQVFRADVPGVLANGLRWFAAMVAAGLGRRNPHALLDRTPLRRLLYRTMPFAKIQESINAGALHALSVTASGYSSGQSVSFFQGAPSLTMWKRARRVGSVATITLDHLMASSAIPFVFAAVKINREYFGDGSMRQIAPISPALHLGAEKVLVIGVRQETNGHMTRNGAGVEYPSLAQIGGHVLSSIFLDALEADLERLRRINETVRLIPAGERARSNGHTTLLRPVDTLLIAPSQNIGEIAVRHKQHFPRSVRYLLRGVGAWKRGGGDLLSYLLFEKPYCRELIELGSHDAMRRRAESEAFFLES